MSSTDLTFLELQDEALHDDFNKLKYRERVKGFLNDWLGELYRTTRLASADQEATVSFTAGNKSAPLPVTALRVQSLRHATTNPDLPLGEVDQDRFDRLSDSTGTRPLLYVLRAGNIDVWPTPAEGLDLQLRFRGDAADMVADGDKPAIPNDYRRILVYHARSELFALEDDPQMADFWMSKRDGKTKALREDLQRRSGRPRRQPSMWSRRRLLR